MAVAATATLTAAALCAPATAIAAGTRPVHLVTAHPAASNAVAGYAWIDEAADSYYAFNTQDSHSGAVTFSKLGTGVDQVEFANLASIAGNVGVQVTTYNDVANCSASGWGADGGNLRVVVDCYTLSGTLADAAFDLILTHPTSPPHGVFDYALDNRPGSAGPLTTDSYNSSHKANSVKRLGTGRYQLLFGGPKSAGTQGIAHVTPYGAQPGNCELAGWTGSAKGELVNVDCFDASHKLQNREFTVTYATASSLMGINSQVVANAFANSKAALYAPALQFDSKSGAKVSVVHYGAGSYEVLPVGSGGNFGKWGGDVQVSAVGTNDQLCLTDGWAQNLTPSLGIQCYDKSGNLADTPFTVQWVVP